MLQVSAIDAGMRARLNDRGANPRWKPEDVVMWVEEARRDLLWRRRPDAFFVSAILTAYPGPVTALTDPIGVFDHFAGCLIDYCCHRAMGVDAEHAANATLAANYALAAAGGVV